MGGGGIPYPELGAEGGPCPYPELGGPDEGGMGGPELDLIGCCILGAAMCAGGILPGPGGPPRPPIGPGAPPGGAEPGGLLQNCKVGASVSLIFAMYA